VKIFFAKAFFTQDIEFNFKKIVSIYKESLEKDCNLLVFGELSLSGLPCCHLLEEQIKLNNTYLERIADLTKGQKTRVLLGCLQFIESTTENGIIRPSQLLNTMALIADGYVEQTTNKTTIQKSNPFNEYTFFDKGIVLKDIKYDVDTYNILMSDDILETKNILFLKERDSEFIICLDNALEPPLKQLEKISKWSRKGIIYMNSFRYHDEKKIKGEFFLFNGNGENIYRNVSVAEDIINLDVSYMKGISDIDVLSSLKDNDEFVNIVARNTHNKVIYETNKKIEVAKNVVLVNFEQKIDGIVYINPVEYVKVRVTQDVKKLILEKIYGENILVLN
jgi:hypothetical protein